MQAAIFTAPETVVLDDIPEPTCGSADVVIQVNTVGLCGTDLHIYRNEYLSQFPVIGGHEFCGVIVQVGKDVTDFKPGDRVTADPNLYCGHCYFCRNLHANHCLNWQGVGVTRPGAFAEYIAVPARACYHLPACLSDTQGAFVEPLSCVIYALNRLRVYPGDEVLILGAGPMGLLLTQALRHSGASQVVVVEKQKARLNLARQLGATTIIAAGPDQTRELRECAPYGFAIVIDATGVPEVIQNAFTYLKPRGQFFMFGVTPKEAEIRLRPYDVFRNDWTILSSFALCYSFQPAIAWLANGVVDVIPLVSHTLPLAEFPAALQRFAAGETLKVHVQPEKSSRTVK
jgi:2-desacetyl-2-hydroxyethyl bacteriochlorophyllide A dehydrogenase